MQALGLYTEILDCGFFFNTDGSWTNQNPGTKPWVKFQPVLYVVFVFLHDIICLVPNFKDENPY